MTDGMELYTEGGQQLPTQMWDKFALGMEYLNGAEVPAGSTAVEIQAQFRPRDILFVIWRVSLISAADVPAFRFNGDAGANYNDRSTYAPTGSAQFTDVPNTTQTLMRLLAPASTAAMVGVSIIINRVGNHKHVLTQSTTATADATTTPPIQFNSSEYVSLGGQIQQIAMRTAGGTATFGADTGFGVYGKDF